MASFSSVVSSFGAVRSVSSLAPSFAPSFAPSLALASVVLLAPARVSAEVVGKQQCVAAYEDAQRLRKESKLTAARERLLVCAQEACPVVVKRDCAQWVGEVEAALPTVVFEAQGSGGRDLVDVKVTVDGRVVAEQVDGKAVALDPGAHVARFESPGLPTVEERFVAREGEKSRRVLVRLGDQDERGTASAVAGGEATEPPRAPVPVAAWVAGGVGVAGLGVFAAFGIAGLSDKSTLDEQQCKPSCDDGAVDSAKTKFLVADVGLAVGVAGLATAAVLYFTRGPATEPSKAEGLMWTVAPTASGGMAGVGGRF